MQAIVLDGPGDPDALVRREVPDPQPGHEDVVVRLRAAALNHRDEFIRLGQYAGLKFPLILGSDGAGVVDRVGDGVTGVTVGQEVVIDPSMGWGDDPNVQDAGFRILGLPDDGTYAELVRVPAANVLPKPSHLTFEEAAAFPLAGVTAYRALTTKGRVQDGETVVITGIGGGVATMALLFAKVLGARVFVTSGSEEKLERARVLGADGGVSYRAKGWVKDLRELCGGAGPDLIIDGAGGDTFADALDLARPGGRVVTYGSTLGVCHGLPVRRIFWKQLHVLGSTMGSEVEFGQVVDLIAREQLHPVVDVVFPLAEASRAHERMAEQGQFGKIVLKMG